MKVELITVPVRMAIEYAFAAYRVNNGYIRDGNDADVFSNKDLVGYSLKRKICDSSTFPAWVPEKMTVLEVTDEDKKNADIIDEHFKKYMFKSLAGKLGQFENDLYTIVCSESIPITRSGIVAYIPEMINRDKDQWTYEKLLRSEYKDSKPADVKKIDGIIKILNVRKIKKDFEMFTIVIAGMNGNLYQFYKNELSVADKEKYFKITARVSGSTVEYSTKLPVTKLNYVKIKNVKTN